MKRYPIALLLLALLLMSVSCSTPPVTQAEGPQDGQYYSWEYVLDKAKAKVYFYGTKSPTTLYAVEISHTSGGVVSIKGYFVRYHGRFSGEQYLYSNEVRTFGGNWEVREVE